MEQPTMKIARPQWDNRCSAKIITAETEHTAGGCNSSSQQNVMQKSCSDRYISDSPSSQCFNYVMPLMKGE